MTPFDALGNKPFENTMEKGEIARREQFLLFPLCFLPVSITFCHFPQICNCRRQTLSVWKSLKLVSGHGLTLLRLLTLLRPWERRLENIV